MTTTPRLYLETPLDAGGVAALAAEKAHYLRNVLRLRDGDAVMIFNGRDGEYSGVIATLTKKGGTIRVLARIRAPEEEPDLWLVFAAVKRDAVDLIAQKATELGASLLQPVATERTNASRVNDERLRAIAQEAAEQCGRLSVPIVASAANLDALLDKWPSDRQLMFCDERGAAPEAEWGGRDDRAEPALDALARASGGRWAILIGPEGGFSRDERERLREYSFVTPVTLGPRILKAETAAIAALVLWQAALGDFRRA